jgi:hypothetical protein
VINVDLVVFSDREGMINPEEGIQEEIPMMGILREVITQEEVMRIIQKKEDTGLEEVLMRIEGKDLVGTDLVEAMTTTVARDQGVTRQEEIPDLIGKDFHLIVGMVIRMRTNVPADLEEI